ncbi:MULTISPECIES: DUF1831 domain-containing protein [unclassified Lactobacillus]|uniref:DUF1831 domain-containing protein n=1 Tax=unclassified Lactobacillus TaxID=2620435 RepID=UPI000EFBDA3D|nr:MULTISPECIES: DUF1831 domain-containing protein [unclassified Lactobacillus]RMC25118.1 hypothetical protein F5ESL0247_03360 [Lactobacillus sp. ESL0247]RMC29273.1 hypothetical protein F5ESL0246_03360 [Lactobacillus sp. ESL0246]RMC32293.1 hypothetical protein F5ESL0245_03365 [Lactobacillus sp. ESL0245]RMC48709.1 hypothetical protein F5ESL0228_03655 [Lactobacillus sp. ESL0228]
MANIAIINGDNRKFTLSPDLKLYALIDVGFVKTKRGNFNYEHPLYNDSPYNAPTKLKMTIDKDMMHLTMVVTDRNGLKKVNIFKNKQLAPTVELLNYILKDLEERKIIIPVKD